MSPFLRAPHARRSLSLNARTRVLLLLLVILLSSSASREAVAQTVAAKTAPPANATVSGRVTTIDGKPVANVAVALTPADFTGDRNRTAGRATTDAEGRYKITNVAAGRYRLQALAPLYTSPEDRGNSPFNSGKTVTVGASEAVENIDVSLVRGGVITGRVTNSEGKPVIGERINVTNADQPNVSGPAAMVVSSFGMVVSPFEFETDDRGVYRIYGVPPGRYLVSVGQPREGGSLSFGPYATQYQRTFYPNATEAAQAKPVEVTADSEATGVDIALAEAPKSYEARGRIIDERGNPVVGVAYSVGTVRANQPMIASSRSDGSTTDESGSFVVHNLVPGRYAVFIANNFGQTPLEVYSDAAQFEVADANVEGIVVKAHRSASISGSVVVEGTTDRAVLARVVQLGLGANVMPAMGESAPSSGQISTPNFTQTRINADGTFRLTGLRPGKAHLNLFSYGETRGFMLLGVQRAGADSSGEIDVGDGEQLTGVRVRVGYGTSVINGQIDLRNAGEPATLPAGARANVFARRVGTQAPANAGGEIDSRGHFHIEGLMGGEYELTVTIFVPRQPSAGPSPRPQPVRQTVSVPDGGETSVTITYDLSKQTERNP
jgi:protocatechuate 3,4-dioxygenase beta subunit